MILIEIYRALVRYGAGIGEKVADDIIEHRANEAPDYVPRDWEEDDGEVVT
jgi:hypothetical protein